MDKTDIATSVPAALSEHAVRFRYQGVDQATGRRISGELTGENPYAIRSSLRRIGVIALFVESIDQTKVHPWLEPLRSTWHHHQRTRRRQTKADLCDAIATMLQAGITLDECLHSLSCSPARSAAERALMARLRDGIRTGTALSTLCRAESQWFDQFDVALIAAGEAAGDLHTTLLAVANHNLRAGSLAQRLFMALFYPALLFVAGLAVLAFMSHQVLPQLVTMIEQGHRQAPSLTLIVMHAGQWLGTWWLLLIPLLWAGMLVLKRGLSRLKPDSRLGRLVHSNVLSHLARRYRAARLAWSLSRLCQAGLPLLEAIAITAESQEDPHLRASLLEAAEVVSKGGDFSTSIGESRLLDPEFSRLLSVGEQSGELVTVLERIADRFHRAADQTADRFVAVINPAAIILLSLLIGILVMACAMPLAQLGDTV